MINTKSIWTHFYIDEMWNTVIECVDGDLRVFIKTIKLIQNVYLFLNPLTHNDYSRKYLSDEANRLKNM